MDGDINFCACTYVYITSMKIVFKLLPSIYSNSSFVIKKQVPLCNFSKTILTQIQLEFALITAREHKKIRSYLTALHANYGVYEIIRLLLRLCMGLFIKFINTMFRFSYLSIFPSASYMCQASLISANVLLRTTHFRQNETNYAISKGILKFF